MTSACATPWRGTLLPTPHLRKPRLFEYTVMFPTSFPTLKKPVASTSFGGRELRDLYATDRRAGQRAYYYTRQSINMRITRSQVSNGARSLALANVVTRSLQAG